MELMKTTTDAAEILYHRYIQGDAQQERLCKEEFFLLDLGVEIQRMRLNARLSEKELADSLGISVSDIELLEAGEYMNPSVQLLDKIASKFNKQVTLSFVDMPVTLESPVNS